MSCLLKIGCTESGIPYEARYYHPSRRTIHVFGRPYFLYLPGMIFAKRGRRLFVAFAKKAEEISIYPASLPNVFESSQVCLHDYCDEHYSDSLDSMIEAFWGSNFNDWVSDCSYRSFKEWFGSWSAWSQLTAEQVEERIKELPFQKLDFGPSWACSRDFKTFSKSFWWAVTKD